MNNRDYRSGRLGSRRAATGGPPVPRCSWTLLLGEVRAGRGVALGGGGHEVGVDGPFEESLLPLAERDALAGGDRAAVGAGAVDVHLEVEGFGLLLAAD